MSLGKVIQSSFWLYVSGIISSFVGYFYWLLASRFVHPSIVGDAAAIIASVYLITSASSLGISYGATRMLGQAHSSNDRKGLSIVFTSAFITNLALSTFAALFIAIMGTFVGLTQLAIPFITVLVLLHSVPIVAHTLYYATLKTHIIALSAILSALVRLTLGILLLYIGTDFVGVMLTFIIGGAVEDAMLLLASRRTVSATKPSLYIIKESIRQGLPSWIPSLILTAGNQLGVIGVYGLTGATQAGTYYIAFQISQIVYTLPLSLLGLMFPVLSGMSDGRKRFASKAIRLTSVIIAPLAAVVIAFPYIPLSLLGTFYVEASFTLQLLMIGCLVAPISYGFNSLIYAYGHYRYVTLLGLATNVPRVALYPILVALYGNNGAALAYISGLFVALFAVYFMARHIGYTVGWGSSLIFAAIPSSIALVMMFLNINWIIGTLVILAVSLFAYARLNLLTKSDLAEVSSAFLSRKQLDQLYPYAKYVLEVLYGR